jgi:hypothetical protein
MIRRRPGPPKGISIPYKGEPFESRYVVAPGPLATPCWRWRRALDTRGYGVVMWRSKLQRAHRISWELHRGKIPAGKWVLHQCDVKICVNPEHLYLGTIAENSRDAVQRNRYQPNPNFGSKNHNSKLTERQVVEMLRLRKQGWLHRELGEKFGVNSETAARICRREGWKHLNKDKD